MQKIFTRALQSIQCFFSTPPVQYFMRRSFHFGTLLALSVYISLKIIFHDFPIEVLEESALVLRLLFTGWALAAVFLGGFRLLVHAADRYSGKSSADGASPATELTFPEIQKNKPFIAEYNLFEDSDAFTIDKTGKLRYRVRVIKASAKMAEKKALAAEPSNGDFGGF